MNKLQKQEVINLRLSGLWHHVVLQWRQRLQGPPRQRYAAATLHGTTTQKRPQPESSSLWKPEISHQDTVSHILAAWNCLKSINDNTNPGKNQKSTHMWPKFALLTCWHWAYECADVTEACIWQLGQNMHQQLLGGSAQLLSCGHLLIQTAYQVQSIIL